MITFFFILLENEITHYKAISSVTTYPNAIITNPTTNPTKISNSASNDK